MDELAPAVVLDEPEEPLAPPPNPVDDEEDADPSVVVGAGRSLSLGQASTSLEFQVAVSGHTFEERQVLISTEIVHKELLSTTVLGRAFALADLKQFFAHSDAGTAAAAPGDN